VARAAELGRAGEAEERARREGLAVLDGGALAAALELGRGEAGLVLTAVAAGRGPRTAGALAGLNVATDSIAPATRHRARMLTSSGTAVPFLASGPASRRSRSRRRCARSSRW
jgi:hypothetical protein